VNGGFFVIQQPVRWTESQGSKITSHHRSSTFESFQSVMVTGKLPQLTRLTDSLHG
jgi:hypothetical protein